MFFQRFYFKDTVLVSVFGVLLHPLQMLLVALQTPGVVLDLRCHVSFLQAVVEDLCFILSIAAERITEVCESLKRLRSSSLSAFTLFAAHLLLLSSLRPGLILSFSWRAAGFFLLHFSSLLLGSPSDKGSVFSWSDGSLCIGCAIKHRFPSSSSSKLTDTTPAEREEHGEIALVISCLSSLLVLKNKKTFCTIIWNRSANFHSSFRCHGNTSS